MLTESLGIVDSLLIGLELRAVSLRDLFRRRYAEYALKGTQTLRV